MSHPTWMRGLKLVPGKKNKTWIIVASYMDAWIEICCKVVQQMSCESHPTWMRGLKFL